MLVLEVKGQDTPKDQTKRRFLSEWIEAVNTHGSFGRWASAVSRHPADLEGILTELAPVLQQHSVELSRIGTTTCTASIKIQILRFIGLSALPCHDGLPLGSWVRVSWESRG